MATITALLGTLLTGAAAPAAASSTAILSAGTIPTLASFIPTAATIGTGLAAAGTIYGGVAAHRSAAFEAKQLKAKAAEERAIAQREARQRRREADLLQSRARTVAGASGGFVTDPSVTSIMTNIGREGEYNALAELYGGASRSSTLRGQARVRRREGRSALIGSMLDAGATIYGGRV